MAMCTECEIVDCGGNGCYIHWNNNLGGHCISCFGEEEFDHPPHEIFFQHIDHIRDINCGGYKCRINDYGVKCEACYGSESEDE